MKRASIIILTLVFLAVFAQAEGFRLGGSGGYYAVADSLYKDAYGSGSFMVGGFIGYDLNKFFELRGEVGYFRDTGEMTLTGEEIKFSIIHVVVGMRFKPLKIRNLNPYLGAGFDFYFFKEKASLGDTSDSTTGFHVETGTTIALGRRFHVDLNLRYVKADATPYDETVRLGGWRTGIGVGYSF